MIHFEFIPSSSIKWLKRLRNDELGKGASDGYNVINVGPNRYQFLDHERVAKLSIDEYQAELQIKASRVDDAGMYICFVSDSSNHMNSWTYKSVLLKIVPSDLAKGNSTFISYSKNIFGYQIITVLHA